MLGMKYCWPAVLMINQTSYCHRWLLMAWGEEKPGLHVQELMWTCKHKCDLLYTVNNTIYSIGEHKTMDIIITASPVWCNLTYCMLLDFCHYAVNGKWANLNAHSHTVVPSFPLRAIDTSAYLCSHATSRVNACWRPEKMVGLRNRSTWEALLLKASCIKSCANGCSLGVTAHLTYANADMESVEGQWWSGESSKNLMLEATLLNPQKLCIIYWDWLSLLLTALYLNVVQASSAWLTVVLLQQRFEVIILCGKPSRCVCVPSRGKGGDSWLWGSDCGSATGGPDWEQREAEGLLFGLLSWIWSRQSLWSGLGLLWELWTWPAMHQRWGMMRGTMHLLFCSQLFKLLLWSHDEAYWL